MNSLTRQNIPFEKDNKSALVVYTMEHQDPAVTLAKKLRAESIATHLIRKSKKHEDDEYLNYAKIYDVSKVYILQDASVVRIISADGSADETKNLEEI